MSTEERTPPDNGAPAAESKLPDLLADFDEALKSGSPDSVTNEQSSLHPGEHAELRRAMVCLRLLEDVFPRRAPNVPHPASLGRFQIQRQLGQGGFGVVYLAHDPKLDREVALKVPHSHFIADAGILARFEREAQAAAELDHPNVVSVFEAGEAGGIAYIAFAYCPGSSLAEWLRQRSEPVASRDAAWLIATLARAVHYAHGRGIVHRDLKPGNVLLEEKTGDRRQETEGKTPTDSVFCLLSSVFYSPKITDFGLAKYFDGEATKTQTGTMAGTPNYMAPEQTMTGPDRIGPATDVYALGAVLYEVLTGRPPFQGETALDTLHQVRFQEPLSPNRLRPGLSRDLVTICLKCLEKTPDKRYATAGALADDLERYLAGKPITARPVTAAERAYRWCRRKPVVAALLAALMVTILGGFAGIFSQWQRAERNAADTKRERDNYLAEATRAERHLGKARNLVGQMTDLGAELARQPGFGQAGQPVFEKALAFQLEVLAEKPGDPAVRLDAARAYRRVAGMYHSLRDWDKALAAFERADSLLAKLADEHPEKDVYRYERAGTHLSLGNTYKDMDKLPLARRAYDTSNAALEELHQKEPKNPNRMVSLANSLINSAAILDGTEGEERDRRVLRAASLSEQAVAVEPENIAFKHEWALDLINAGITYATQKEYAKAEAALRQAVKVREEALAGDKNQRMNRYLGLTHIALGRFLSRRTRREEAAEHYETGVTILNKVVQQFPQDAACRNDLAAYLVEASANYKGWNQPRLDELLDQAAVQFDRLAQDFPPEPRNLRDQARFFANRGKDLLAKKDTAGAEIAYQKAVTADERLLAEFAPRPDDRNGLAAAWAGLASVWEASGQLEKAEAMMHQVRYHLERWLQEAPKEISHLKELAKQGSSLTRLLQKQQKFKEAIDAGNAVAREWRRLVDLEKDVSANRRGLADTLHGQANLLHRLGQEEEAISLARLAMDANPDYVAPLNTLAWFLATSADVKLHSHVEAVNLAQRAVKLAPKAANIHNTLGAAYYRNKDYAAAIATMDEAIRLRGRGTSEDWFFQAMARWQLGDKEAARRDYDKAVERMEGNSAENAELRRFRAEAEALMGLAK